MATSRADRAKQFMAFDALKGLQEAYREKEIEYDDRIDLSEESEKELSEKLVMIEHGTTIKIKYYLNRKYITVLGIVKKIDTIKRKIILEDETSININDIVNIEII